MENKIGECTMACHNTGLVKYASMVSHVGGGVKVSNWSKYSNKYSNKYSKCSNSGSPVIKLSIG